ncbi:MAG: cell envelope biogenesis protein TolA [Afipia sp.]|jgi:hypothetical protein
MSARRLKTFQTSMGFFDLAIAAPSMKAALEAWGAESNLFHMGLAKQVEDADVVQATMAKPGVVLKRPVGSNGLFTEEAKLPASLTAKKRRHNRPAKAKSTEADEKSAREAAREYERVEQKRKRERLKELAEIKRSEKAVASAQAAIDKAEQAHQKRLRKIEKQRAALENRAIAEDSRWNKQKKRLHDALRRARSAP